MSVQDNTITAQVMNNLDQLYTAHGQGIQPLYDEASGKTPAFTYNNVMSAINNGYLPVYVENSNALVSQKPISSFITDSTTYRVDIYGWSGSYYSASNPDSYLTIQYEGGE